MPLPTWVNERLVSEAVQVAISPLWKGRLVTDTPTAWVLEFQNMPTAACFVSGNNLWEVACFHTGGRNHARFDTPVTVFIRK